MRTVAGTVVGTKPTIGKKGREREPQFSLYKFSENFPAMIYVTLLFVSHVKNGAH